MEAGISVKVFWNKNKILKQAKKQSIPAEWVQSAIMRIKDDPNCAGGEIVKFHGIKRHPNIDVRRYRQLDAKKAAKTYRLMFSCCDDEDTASNPNDDIVNAGISYYCVHIIAVYKKNNQEDLKKNFNKKGGAKDCC